LSRPPIQRKISEPLQVPGTLPGLVEKVTVKEDVAEELENGFTKDFYKSAVENMPQIMFCTDKQGVVTYLNPQWYRYTGWPIYGGSPELWADVCVKL
jgi:PAS domain-containing protein